MQSDSDNLSCIPSLKVIPIAAHTDDAKDDYFEDNLEHLQALEYEARLRMLIACLQRGSIAFAKGNGPPDEMTNTNLLGIPPEQLTLKNLQAFLKEAEAGNRNRTSNSIKRGIDLNFEKFCDLYHLDRFERLVVMLLFVNGTCMEFRKMFNEYRLKGQKSENGEMTIGEILSLISSDYRVQLQNRHYFSIHGTLLREEILPQYSYNSMVNILDLDMYLHERAVRYIIGDNNTYNVNLQCVSREKPTIPLERVILPEKLKHDVVTLADNYARQMADEDTPQLKEFYGYGTGLVFLFHGPSGTGKTMLAHALAHSLNKELLQLKTDEAVKNEFTFAGVMRYLFREARLTDAIAFFDECDDLILKNPSQCKQFLMEIEKAQCITILATNKTVSLDPSLERRLTMKVHFELPDEDLREQMWKALIPDTVTLDEDVSCKTLAQKYIFTGGLIKNTLLMAISNKGKPAEEERIIVTTEDIEKAAEYQQESMYLQQGIEKIYTPHAAIDELPLKAHVKKDLKALGAIIDKLKGNGRGLNVLIGSSDITTGVECVNALAGLCNYKVRSMAFSHIFFSMGSIKEPFSQLEMNMIEYVFKPHIGHQAITLVTDYGGLFKYLAEHPMAQLDEKNFQFRDMMRSFEGIFFMVTMPFGKHGIPAEFDHYIEIKHPPEELQIRQWEKHLKGNGASDAEIIKLVEMNQMHLHEIDFTARQATIISYAKGREGLLILEDIQEAMARSRSKKEGKILFGG